MNVFDHVCGFTTSLGDLKQMIIRRLKQSAGGTEQVIAVVNGRTGQVHAYAEAGNEPISAEDLDKGRFSATQLQLMTVMDPLIEQEADEGYTPRIQLRTMRRCDTPCVDNDIVYKFDNDLCAWCRYQLKQFAGISATIDVAIVKEALPTTTVNSARTPIFLYQRHSIRGIAENVLIIWYHEMFLHLKVFHPQLEWRPVDTL